MRKWQPKPRKKCNALIVVGCVDEPNARDTIVERYLASRGIRLDQWPAALRFHPRARSPEAMWVILFSRCRRWSRLSTRRAWPGAAALHLSAGERRGKVDMKSRRPYSARLLAERCTLVATAGEWFAMAEGIETALSVAVACWMPAWAGPIGRRNSKTSSCRRRRHIPYMRRSRRTMSSATAPRSPRRTMACRWPARTPCNAA